MDVTYTVVVVFPFRTWLDWSEIVTVGVVESVGSVQVNWKPAAPPRTEDVSEAVVILAYTETRYKPFVGTANKVVVVIGATCAVRFTAAETLAAVGTYPLILPEPSLCQLTLVLPATAAGTVFEKLTDKIYPLRSVYGRARGQNRKPVWGECGVNLNFRIHAIDRDFVVIRYRNARNRYRVVVG